MTFRPSRHGFRFANRFPLPLGWPGAYGLCGGMAALAAEAYLTGEPPPAAETPPAPGTPLHRRLVGRQLRTLGAPALGGAWRYVRWMRMDPAERAARTAGALREAREHLREGRLVLLGLLYTLSIGRVWENHQVLAYEAEAAGGLRVYDPNRPGRDDVLLRPPHPGETTPAPLVLSVAGVGTRSVHGAFITQPLPAVGAGGRAPGRIPS